MFGRQQTTEGGLAGRIERLSRRDPVDGGTAPPPTTAPPSTAPPGAALTLEKPVVPAPVSAPLSLADGGASGATIEERLAIAREELSARLGAEIPPERRAMLKRGELSKNLGAAGQARFVGHAHGCNPPAPPDPST